MSIVSVISYQACCRTDRGLHLVLSDKNFFKIQSFLPHTLEENKGSIVLIDLDLGFAKIRDFLQKHHNMFNVIVWSGTTQTRECVSVLFSLGTKGFLQKSTTNSGLIQCLWAVDDGNLWFDDGIFSYQDALGAFNTKLTKRELDVFDLVLRNYSNGKIAEILSITVGTIKVHRKMIARKIRNMGRRFPWFDSSGYFDPNHFK